MIGRIALLTFFTFHVFALIAQRTVGLLHYDPPKSFDGFNLMYPHNQPNLYLLDNCGQIAHVWEDDPSFQPGNTAYILPDGSVLKGKRKTAIAGDPIWAGGGGGIVEWRDWDNNLLWTFELNDSLHRLHHDFAPMPNGHLLMLAWEAHTVDEVLNAGMDTSLLIGNALWAERIIEVDPATNAIVWEWRVWDHLIQDFDPTKANFGDVAANPQLIDINYDAQVFSPSWLHINAIDYDPVNDMILVSTPTFSEVWIMDHSTSTQEAAGHSGGFGGRGGDLLYRWGNPATYLIGASADQQLFFQHDPHWLDDFVDPAHPFYGKVAVFNNQIGPDFSAGMVFTPPFDMYSWSFPMSGNVWGPADPDWTFFYPGDSTRMHSTGLSSIQLLPNGNWLFCSGRQGYSFEVTPSNEIVWEYVTPLKGGTPVAQGTILALNDNLTFRLKRYPADYTAFAGKDLSPKGWIELNPDSAYCDTVLPSNQVFQEPNLRVFPSPTSEVLVVEWLAAGEVELAVFDILGRSVLPTVQLFNGRNYLDTSTWNPGNYFIRINGKTTARVFVQR